MPVSSSSAPLHKVVIVGGGFGGLYAAKGLRKAPVQITLLDRRNFHLFQPLLYQVATGGLSPANIAVPLRALLSRNAHCEVLLAEVVDFDVAGRRVILAPDDCGGPAAIAYDTLLVAAGARFNYFGHDEWRPLAPGLKSIEDATEIRRRVLTAFERAERETDDARRKTWLTFVIVGGGATGVELAGALAELARYTLRRDFHSIDPAEAKIVLIEGCDRLLPPFAPPLSVKTRQSLERLGVVVRTEATVTEVQRQSVMLKTGERSERIDAATVLWTAGVRAARLSEKLAAAAQAPVDRSGRIIVQPDLTLPGHPEIFAIGDMAHFAHQTGEPLAGVAPVAMQQGRYAARAIRARLAGQTEPPFRYRDKGSMAVIGRAAGVADLGWIKLSGFLGWLGWLFIHLTYLARFENRLLVLTQWAWNYWTRNRSARLITRTAAESGDEEPM
ncbi:MAG TPA: NAD(P)/FAD-dependent oxidoreductase [Pirellulales bacterium]|jgi:NADH dehydrogenase|nr:NAD(P)/FAD-dependent oxidoreductase [Pirellulales bacterium]